MDHRNEAPAFECRFLDSSYFDPLLETFREAFSDYVLPFNMDATRFKNHLNLNAVDLNRSVGCFEQEQMVGFSLNGFGDWKGKTTVYDAGTGVIPNRRRRGASMAMFDFMVPVFRDAGIEQYLLEVITHNEPAVNLYKKLGFHIERELVFMEAKSLEQTRLNDEFELRKITAAELIRLKEFWDARPSWQNSNEAIERSEQLKTILGAFVDGECVGYAVFSTGRGRVAQFAVDNRFRGKGIGSRLLAQIRTEMQPDAAMRVINLDKSLTDTQHFFEARGFKQVLAQYEMTLPLS